MINKVFIDVAVDIWSLELSRNITLGQKEGKMITTVLIFGQQWLCLSAGMVIWTGQPWPQHFPNRCGQKETVRFYVMSKISLVMSLWPLCAE